MTASVFLGFDLGRIAKSPALADAEVQIVAANVFDLRPPTIRNGYPGIDPYNNPPNPRTISLVLTKRFSIHFKNWLNIIRVSMLS